MIPSLAEPLKKLASKCGRENDRSRDYPMRTQHYRREHPYSTLGLVQMDSAAVKGQTGPRKKQGFAEKGRSRGLRGGRLPVAEHRGWDVYIVHPGHTQVLSQHGQSQVCTKRSYSKPIGSPKACVSQSFVLYLDVQSPSYFYLIVLKYS